VSNGDEDADFRAVDGPTKALTDRTETARNVILCRKDFIIWLIEYDITGPGKIFVVFQNYVSRY